MNFNTDEEEIINLDIFIYYKENVQFKPFFKKHVIRVK